MHYRKRVRVLAIEEGVFLILYGTIPVDRLYEFIP